MNGIDEDGALHGAARRQPVDDVVTRALAPAALAADAAAVQSTGSDAVAELARQRRELLNKLVTALTIEAGTTDDGAMSYNTGSFADAADWIDRALATGPPEPAGGDISSDDERAEIRRLHALAAQSLAVVGRSLRVWSGKDESAGDSPSTRTRAGWRAQRDLNAALDELTQLSTELDAALRRDAAHAVAAAGDDSGPQA